MTRLFLRERLALVRATVVFGVAAVLLQGCDSVKNTLLEAQHPDVIDPQNLASSAGADALRLGTLQRLSGTTAGGESVWLLGGLLTDEWRSGDTFNERDQTDQRDIQTSNANIDSAYVFLHRTRNSAMLSIQYLTKYRPAPISNIGQMYVVKGYAELESAENFCNGQPFSNSTGDALTFGTPVSVVQAFTMASADADSALANVSLNDKGSNGANGATVANGAKILKARAQLGLGNYAAAAAAVAGVPTSYTWLTTFSLTAGDNQIWALNNSAKRWSVGDSADATGQLKNAIPFVSANDPRVPTAQLNGSGNPALVSFDTKTPFFSQQIWGRDDPVAVLSGVDARLIEAEGKVNLNDFAGAAAILNALRAAPPSLGSIDGTDFTPAPMPPLATPTTKDAAVDQLFREKALWTFGRGQRLGDLRRLIRQYNRAPDTVFPVGAFFKGGSYGTDVNLPVTDPELNNPNFHGCTDRNA
ncbi:MAG TPA: hypothetical protein VJO33_01775 [Gemmatimonadaceae bacterium]|nr:hypothetical protein [Gemmatimonadaceae bacterium]